MAKEQNYAIVHHHSNAREFVVFFFFKFILKVDPKASIDHINVPCELHRNPFVTLSLQPLRNLSEMAM